MLSVGGELTIAIRNGLKRSAVRLVEKEEDFVRLEKQLDEAVVEENGRKRKLTQQEKEEILEEVKGKTGMADNIPLLTTKKTVKEFKENWKDYLKLRLLLKLQ